jgi:hypothetical protein
VKKEKGGGEAPSLKLKMELSKIKQPQRRLEVVYWSKCDHGLVLPFGKDDHFLRYVAHQKEHREGG